MIVAGVILGLIILTIVVVIHELGHAIAARKSGVVVEEFGIGFPPRAWAKKLKNGVLLTVNWLPLGGFVKLQGAYDSDNEKGDFGRATVWQKTKILLAGVAMNWVTAFVAFTALAFTGLPNMIPNQYTVASDTTTVQEKPTFAYIADDSPAKKADIQPRDMIVAIDGVSQQTTEDVLATIKQKKGTEIAISLLRDGKSIEKKVTLNAERVAHKGLIGGAITQRETRTSTWSAPIVGATMTVQVTQLTFSELGKMVVNLFDGIAKKFSTNEATQKEADVSLQKAGSGVAGPVGLLGTIMPAVLEQGMQGILLVIAIISIGLAVMNILPIPALDGGRWAVMLWYRLVLRRELKPETEDAIHGRGFVGLMLLFVLITYVDVTRFF